MVEFVYNNTKNINIDHIPLELSYSYYPYAFFEDKTNLYPKSRSANELAKELRNLISIYQQNLICTQKLQKQAPKQDVKPCSYASGKKVWFNSKYIRIKQNPKPKTKCFGLSQVLDPVRKKAYKLESSIKQKIYAVFYISVLAQNTIRTKQVNKLLKLKPELNKREYEKYKVEVI